MATYDSGGVPVADQAKAWVDAVNSATGPSGGWRLQFIRMRTRRRFGKPLCGDDPSTLPPPDPGVTDANGEPVASVRSDPGEGECPEAPVRIRRFVSGCPWALVDQAVRYLHRIAPYRGIVYNGVRLDGAYRPTVTQWMRDEQAQSPGERGSLGTYTLVQDLVEITCCGDREELGTGSSCQSSEETTYVWDADSVEPLPVSCEQGVTYSLRAVQRDEDGNFSYQLVKTTARTKAWGPVDVSCQGLEKVVEWGWRNLYGDPVSGFESRGCGEVPPYAKVDVPECGTPVPGVRVESQWQMNQDCTWDVRVRRRTAEPGTGEWDDGMSCRPSHHVVYRNSPDIPAVAPPAVGERVSAGFRLNDDLTWDGEATRTEAPPPETWSWVDGSACRRRRTTVLDDWRSRPDVPAVGEGETLDASLSRNEDCTWNARFSVTEAPDPDHMTWEEGSECQPTTSHRYVNQKSYEGLIPPPAPGQRVNGDVNRNPDCTYDVRYSVTDAYRGDDVTWDDGTGCQVRHHTLWIDRAERPVVGPAAPGETVSASLRFDPSSCTWSGEKVVTEAAQADHMSWEEGSSCQPVHSDRYVNQPSYAGLVPAPARGQRVSADVGRNADCTYDVKVSVAEAAGGDHVDWTEGTQCRSVDVDAYWNQLAVDIPAPGRGQRVGASVSRNPDCTYDYQYRVTNPADPHSDDWVDGTCTQTTSHSLFTDQADIDHGAEQRMREAGVTVRASWARNEDCTYSGQVSVAESRPDEYDWQYNGNACEDGRRSTHVYVETAQRDKPDPGKHAPEQGETVNVRMSKNPDCTWDAQWEVSKTDPDEYDWEYYGNSCKEGEGRRSTHVYVETAQRERPDLKKKHRPGQGETVNARLSKNPDCTWEAQWEVSRTDPDEYDWEYNGNACKDGRRSTHVYVKTAQRDKPDLNDLKEHPLEVGETVNARLSKNPDCTWEAQWEVSRTDPDEYDWEYSSNACKEGGGRRSTHVFVKTAQRTKPDLELKEHPLEAGETVNVRMSKNPDCTWDAQWEVSKTDYDNYEWDYGTKCGPRINRHVYSHTLDEVEDVLPRLDDLEDGVTLDASVVHNEDCTHDIVVTKTTSREVDTDWITWESNTMDIRMRKRYVHGIRMFRHMRERPAIPRKLPRFLGDELPNWTTIRVDQNDDCTWSGEYAFSNLVEWEAAGGDGGIRENDQHWYRLPVTRDGVIAGYDLYHAPTIAFIGSGNEGTEHYWKTEGASHAPGNGQLPNRTYYKYVEVHYHDDDHGVWHFLGGDDTSVQTSGRPSESKVNPNS